MTTSQLMPALIIPFVLWRVYSRVRRNIGRQPFRSGRLKFGAIFFSGLILLISVACFPFPTVLAALGGGVAVGAALGVLGLRLTRFEKSGEQIFYIPNSILGISITLLFIGRLAYRIAFLVSAGPGEAARSSMVQNPLTLAFFGLTAGYYVVYNIGVLIHGRKVATGSSV